MKAQFYVSRHNESGKPAKQVVNGYIMAISIPNWREAYKIGLHSYEHKGKKVWSATHIHSGHAIIMYQRTRRNAIEFAITRLESAGEEGFKKVVHFLPPVETLPEFEPFQILTSKTV